MSEKKLNIDVPNIPSNAKTGPKEVKKERERMEPVIKKDHLVSSKSKKESVAEKALKKFLNRDMEEIKEYVIKDVIIPGIQNGIMNAIGIAFFGPGRYENRGGYSYGGRTNYSSSYRSSYGGNHRDDRRNYEKEDREPEKVDYRNIVVRERYDAEEIVRKLRERIRDRNEVSLAELYDLINVTSSYNDNNWGWTREREIGYRRVADGFLIDLEEPRYLN